MSSQSPSDETLAKDPKLSSNLIAIKIIYEKLRSDLVGIGGTTTVKNEITSIINNLQYAIMHPYFNGVQLLRASAYKQAKKKLPLMQEKVNTIIRLWDEETVPLELEVTAMVNDIDDSLDKYGIKGNERLQFNHQINAAMMNNSWGEANDLEQFKISAEKVKKDLAKIQSEINKIYGNPKRKSKSVSKSNKSKSKSKSKSNSKSKSKSNSKSKRISNSKSKSKSKSKSLTKLFSGSISKKVSPAKMDSFKDLYNYNPQTLRQWKPCRGDQERNYKSSRCKKFKFHCPPGQGHSRSNDKCVTLAQYLVYLSKKYKELHKADKLKRKSTKRRKSGSLKRKSGSRKRKSVKRKSKKRKSVSKRKSSSHKSKSRSSSHKKSRSSSHKRKSSSHKSPKPTGRAMRARKPVKYF